MRDSFPVGAECAPGRLPDIVRQPVGQFLEIHVTLGRMRDFQIRFLGVIPKVFTFFYRVTSHKLNIAHFVQSFAENTAKILDGRRSFPRGLDPLIFPVHLPVQFAVGLCVL